jgi:hypothetical protein
MSSQFCRWIDANPQMISNILVTDDARCDSRESQTYKGLTPIHAIVIMHMEQLKVNTNIAFSSTCGVVWCHWGQFTGPHIFLQGLADDIYANC